VKTVSIVSLVCLAVLLGCHGSGRRNTKPARLSPDPRIDDNTYLLRERSAVLTQLESPSLSLDVKRRAYTRLILLEHVLEQGGVDRPKIDYEHYREMLRQSERAEPTVPVEAAPSASSTVRLLPAVGQR
jgi:hypothetical protein